ncbi:MAG TPA: shikimate kinase [Acidimicrobiia bacterium]|nr:shikimate kinase [Acidimicrobiia bacterium]
MLWLIGMMGSGKTTVGMAVAAHLGLDFVDTDLLVASVTESSITELWDDEGEQSFRHLESQMIASAAAGEPVVVATGGGAILDRTNIDVMRSSGLVVWLTAAPSTLAERVGRDGSRPLLAQADDPVERLGTLVEEREARYREAAHATVATDGKTVESVADEVLAVWNAS